MRLVINSGAFLSSMATIGVGERRLLNKIKIMASRFTRAESSWRKRAKLSILVFTFNHRPCRKAEPFIAAARPEHRACLHAYLLHGGVGKKHFAAARINIPSIWWRAEVPIDEWAAAAEYASAKTISRLDGENVSSRRPGWRAARPRAGDVLESSPRPNRSRRRMREGAFPTGEAETSCALPLAGGKIIRRRE